MPRKRPEDLGLGFSLEMLRVLLYILVTFSYPGYFEGETRNRAYVSVHHCVQVCMYE